MSCIVDALLTVEWVAFWACVLVAGHVLKWLVS